MDTAEAARQLEQMRPRGALELIPDIELKILELERMRFDWDEPRMPWQLAQAELAATDPREI